LDGGGLKPTAKGDGLDMVKMGGDDGDDGAFNGTNGDLWGLGSVERVGRRMVSRTNSCGGSTWGPSIGRGQFNSDVGVRGREEVAHFGAMEELHFGSGTMRLRWERLHFGSGGRRWEGTALLELTYSIGGQICWGNSK
jgi:hypothetical protein